MNENEDNNNKKKEKAVLKYNDYEHLVDDDLIEKIKRNREKNENKSTASVVFVRILSVLSLIMSVYILYSKLYTPIFLKENASIDNVFYLLQVIIYGGIVLINIFAAINLFLLNNLGRILQFIVLFIFIALQIFYIFYERLSGNMFESAIWNIVIAGIFLILILTKPVSKAF